jgi:hypothetical protein
MANEFEVIVGVKIEESLISHRVPEAGGTIESVEVHNFNIQIRVEAFDFTVGIVVEAVGR